MRKYVFSASAVVACCLLLNACSASKPKRRCTELGWQFRYGEYEPPGVVEIVGGNIGDASTVMVCCVTGKTGTVKVTSADGLDHKTLQCHSQGITSV
jgi:hypothetical protein